MVHGVTILRHSRRGARGVQQESDPVGHDGGNPPFAIGDQVRKRSDHDVNGEVLAVKRAAGEWYCALRGSGRQRKFRADDLEPIADSMGLERDLCSGAIVGPDAFRRHVAAIKLHRDRGLTDTILSFGASRTEFHPYQYIPLLKILDQERRRILIGDEVGLGKTIEAAYIIQEQIARSGPMSRLLIVCPAALRAKWQRELMERFQLDFEILDLAEACRRIPFRREEELAGRPLRAIVSLQSIRNKKFLVAIGREPAPPFSTVVVDEVHHCRNPSTKSHAAIEAVVEDAEAVVFLSATPVQTHSEDLFHTLNLLLPGEFPTTDVFHSRLAINERVVQAETLLRSSEPDAIAQALDRLGNLNGCTGREYLTKDPEYPLVLEELRADEPDTPQRRVELQESVSRLNQISHIFTRTKRRDVRINSAVRSPSNHFPTMNPYEAVTHQKLLGHLFKRYTELHDSNIAKFVLSTYERYVSSSLAAAVLRLREACTRDEEDLEDLEADEFGFAEELDSDSRPRRRYHPAQDRELADIVHGLDTDRLESEDSKFNTLRNVLDLYFTGSFASQNPSHKVVIFSFFRGAIDYLERRLRADGIRLVRIDGSVPSLPNDPERDERGRRIAQFREDPDIQVLLTSEVGGEGLDFQFCNTIVNWDLPWNPMKVEQRIGRVDRLKQQADRIFVVNIALDGTIEKQIIERLYARIGLFERTIGELEPILGDRMEELQDCLFDPNLTEAERTRRIEDAERSLQREQANRRQIEARADELMGQDLPVREELERIRRFGRYLGGTELRHLVEYELERLVEGSGFDELDDEPGVYRISRPIEVSNLVTDALPKADPDGMRFRDRLRGSKPVFVTFEGHLAERSLRHVDPLHAKHPLVRAITARLDPDAVNRQHAIAVHVAVPPEVVDPGEYFFGYAIIEETGFMPSRTLAAAAVRLTDEQLTPLPAEAANTVLGTILSHGQEVPSVSSLPADLVAECLEMVDDILTGAIAARGADRRRRFASMKTKKRLAITQEMERRIASQEQRIRTSIGQQQRGTAGGGRGLGGFRKRLENLNQLRDDQLSELEATPLPELDFSLLGAGVVIIDPASPGRHP